MPHRQSASATSKLFAIVCVCLILGLNVLFIEHQAHTLEHDHDEHHCQLIHCVKNLVSTHSSNLVIPQIAQSYAVLPALQQRNTPPNSVARAPPYSH
ncbi:DUF2607 family protein [Vibrio sp. FNV 38]|nr:DUF2607 family protein [Vibrio sp. FNV 38]